MSNRLVLKICFANLRQGAKSESMYEEIEKRITEAEVYRLDKSKATAAAIELALVLHATVAIATVTNLLYTIWKDHKKEGQLYVAADPENRIDIMITENTSKKELDEFQEKIIKLTSSEREIEIYQETMDEISQRRLWIRTK
jgi:RNA binding exosome subunit